MRNYFLVTFLATGLLAAAFLAAGLFTAFFALGLFDTFLAAGLLADFLVAGFEAAGLSTAFFSADFFTLIFLGTSSSSSFEAFFFTFLGVAFLVDSLPVSALLAGAFLGAFFLAFSPSAAVLAIL